MANYLTVKFPWALRRREEAFRETKEGNSRSAKYMRNLKSNKSERYESYLAKERTRSKDRYLKVSDLSEIEQIERRRKWALTKAIQRKRKRGNEETNCQPSNKKIKLMTRSEKQEYERKRKRLYRYKKAAQMRAKSSTSSTKVGRSPKSANTKVGSSHSKSTMYRKIRDIKEKMPSSPTAYGKVIDSLVSKTTPRKQKEMLNRGFARKTLFPADSDKSQEESTKGKKADSKNTKAKPKSRSSANVKSRYLFAKACKVNKLRYKDVRKFGVSNHIYSKVGRKPSPEIIRKRRGLPIETVSKIKKYWYQISRPLPIKKRVKKKEPLYLLECSYITAFRNFKKENKVKVGYVMFIKHKPKNVRQIRPHERITCCCIKCENVKLLTNALNNATLRMEKPNTTKLRDEKDCSDLTLCEYETFPKKQCIDRSCCECGTKKIDEHFEGLIKELGTQDLKYNQWKHVKETKIVKGTEKMVTSVQLITEVKTIAEVVAGLKEEVEGLSAHLFRAKWQQYTFAQIKDHMPPKSAVMVLDFAENYSCLIQNEVQSHHWALSQVTIHPVVAYINNSESNRPFTNIQSFIFISDDRKHDSAAVETFSETVICELKEVFQVKKIIQYTDCCAGQYRGKSSFADLSFASENIEIERNYFESGHGKSAADGLSAVVKNAASRSVLNNQFVIRNAKEFHQFCEQKLGIVGDGIFQSESEKYEHSQRKFYYVEKNRIEEQRRKEERNVKTVRGTMKVHQVKAIKPYEIHVRNLTCFCTTCTSGIACVTQTCENEKAVGQWTKVQLLTQSQSTKYVQQQKQDVGDSDPEVNDPISIATPSNQQDDKSIGSPGSDERVDTLLTEALRQSRLSYEEHEHDTTSNMENFQTMVAAKGWEIDGTTPMDGNCCFWAVSRQLDKLGFECYTHSQLRQKVVAFIEDLQEAEKSQLSNFLTTDLDTYISGMSRDGTYADHICLQMLCKMLNIGVQVVHAQTSDIILYPENQKRLVLGYLPDNQHYVSLKTIETFKPEDFVAVRLLSGRRKLLYLAKVLQVHESGDVQVRYLKASRHDGVYLWSSTHDIFWQSQADIIRKLSNPEILPGRGLRFRFLLEEIQQCQKDL